MAVHGGSRISNITKGGQGVRTYHNMQDSNCLACSVAKGDYGVIKCHDQGSVSGSCCVSHIPMKLH